MNLVGEVKTESDNQAERLNFLAELEGLMARYQVSYVNVGWAFGTDWESVRDADPEGAEVPEPSTFDFPEDEEPPRRARTVPIAPTPIFSEPKKPWRKQGDLSASQQKDQKTCTLHGAPKLKADCDVCMERGVWSGITGTTSEQIDQLREAGEHEAADMLQFDDGGRCLICDELQGGDRSHRCWGSENHHSQNTTLAVLENVVAKIETALRWVKGESDAEVKCDDR